MESEPNTKYLNKRSLLTLSIVGLIALIFGSSLYYFFDARKSLQASVAAAEDLPISAFPITVPTIKYGFALDTFQVIEKELQSGQFLGDILQKQNLDYPSIERLVQNAKDVFDVRHLRVGKPYMILTKDSTQRASYFIYEPNVYEYVVFELQGDMKVRKVERPVTTEQRTASGVIETSLWNTMVNNGLSYELTAKMEDALQWSIDFHHLQKGDQVTLLDKILSRNDTTTAMQVFRGLRP